MSNLFSALRAAFPADLSATAVEATAGDGSPLLYTWSDLDRASARMANLLVSLNVGNIAELHEALKRARAADRSYLISITIDGPQTTPEGGCWWEVGIPEVSTRPAVVEARKELDEKKQQQRL